MAIRKLCKQDILAVHRNRDFDNIEDVVQNLCRLLRFHFAVSESGVLNFFLMHSISVIRVLNLFVQY